jgi:hypothetical protein
MSDTTRRDARQHYDWGRRALENCHQHTGSAGVENASFHAQLAIAHFAAGLLLLALAEVAGE